MKVVDVLGKPCPMPVIEAKKALEEENEAILVKVDSNAALENLKKLAGSLGHDFSSIEKEGEFHVTITKNSDQPITSQPTVKPSVLPHIGPEENLVVTIGNNAMGSGSEELGKVLIKSFIYSLTELQPAPKFLLFFNAGVFLTVEGANTIEDLQKLEAKGTKVFSCGTCIDYFNLQGKLAVGEITDMYGTTERMATASRLINI